MLNKAEARKNCVLCNELREDLKKVGIATFLHKHIGNTHLADVILDFVQDLVNKKGKEMVKYFCKHCVKIWNYKADEREDEVMTTVCPTCYNPLAKVNVTFEETNEED